MLAAPASSVASPSPVTGPGLKRLAVPPLPSSPKPLLPQVHGVPGPAAPAGTAAAHSRSAATRAARRKDRVRMPPMLGSRPGPAHQQMQ